MVEQCKLIDEKRAIWDRALDFHRRAQVREAEALYRQLLQSRFAAWAHYQLALIERSMERYADAGANLQRALALEPLNPDFHNELGCVMEALGLIKEAAASYARAIELRVGHVQAQDNLTRLQVTHGYADEDNLVSIITPTIGRLELARAIRSVSAQRYRNIQHLIVADGPEVEGRVRNILDDVGPTALTQVLVMPWNTGRDDFRGHRIYAASVHLVTGRFVSFLDDDNWLDDDHVSSLVDCVIGGQLEWAYSLRKIIAQDGSFLANDDCHSLGAWESIEAVSSVGLSHLVDTNCYFIRRDIAVAYSAFWHRGASARSPDFVLCEALLAHQRRFRTTGKYSVNYSLGPARPAAARFFLEGNAAMRQRYPNGFPWTV